MKEKNFRKMTALTRNYTGNAALCALLIMIMLLAIGSAALVVTGRSSIDEMDNMPVYIPAAEDSSEVPEEAPTEEETAPEPLMQYPEKDFEFMKMELPEVDSRYNVLLDVTNNKMYSGKNISKKCYPASLTKIMTLVIALENVEDLSDTYKFTKTDIKSLEDQNASVAGFAEGEKVTIKDLLYGAMLPSGADATLGIANYVAGSEEAFVDMMNAKVEELGLTGTHFENASGLHDKNHYTTPLDMALIVEYAINNEDISEQFLKITGAKEYTTKKSNKNPDGITLTSIFFERYEGFFIDRDKDDSPDAEIVGGKTGFTDEALYTLASIYKIDDTYYVCITMKSNSDRQATDDNIAIAERYLPTYDLLDDELGDSSQTGADSNQDESKIDATPSAEDQTETSSSQSDSNADMNIQTVIPDVTTAPTDTQLDVSDTTTTTTIPILNDPESLGENVGEPDQVEYSQVY